MHLERGEGRDRDPLVRLVPCRLEHEHAGDRARLRSGRRPSAREHDAALGVRLHGRDLLGADPAGALAGDRVVAQARLPTIALVPARDRRVGRCGGDRPRVWLDRDRGGASAVDRLQRDAHFGRRYAGERHLDHVRADRRALRRSRYDSHRLPPRDVAALAGRRPGAGRCAVRPRVGAASRGGRDADMSEADAVAGVLLVGATMYAVFGGADFGAGLWSLLAGWGGSGRRPRALIDWAIGPVWEANHVWLIFTLVVLWTGFPTAFESIFSTLFIPLSLAALGIVLRGAGFAFQHTAKRARGRALAVRFFGLASVLTPFFMGTVVGAIAGERVPVGNEAGDLVTSWLNPLSLVLGVLFVATGAYLSAVFLVSEARRAGTPDLERYFVNRALGAALVAGALAVAGLIVLHRDARFVFDGLKGDALPLVIVSFASGIAVLFLLQRGVRRGAPVLTVAAVVAVIWAWGVAQHPYLLPQVLTIDAAAAPGNTLTTVLIVFGIALVLVVPALALLYTLVQRNLVEETERPAGPDGDFVRTG